MHKFYLVLISLLPLLGLGDANAQLDCNGAIALNSGIQYNGTTVGGQKKVSTYNNDPWWQLTGPERVHSFYCTGGTVEINLTNKGAALDLILLNACDANNFNHSGGGNSGRVNSTIKKNLNQGTYYIIVDGWQLAEGTYTLTIISENVLPERPKPDQSTPLCNLDKSKMIPLRDAKYRKNQYVASLKGSAISSNTPYEIHFDTGSWTTSIPGGVLNLDKIKVLKADVTDPWGNLTDLVSGQLILESVDGTPYILNDYQFYAIKDKNTKKYLPDDRTAPYSSAIMGAFPSVDSYTKLPSIPYAIAVKYAPNNMGLGIISDCYNDIAKNWDFMKSYLQIGIDAKFADKLNYRTDVPNWKDPKDFEPEAVPGFNVKVRFPDTDKTIENLNLIATVDTGAPDLTLKLGSNDPQNQAPFASHFVKDGPWANWNDEYRNNAKTLINATVSIEFKDSQGAVNSYEFPVGNNPYISPMSLYSGNWSSGVPWRASSPSFPSNRINLGNTVYFYCPVYFWDIKNKRVGIGFRNPNQCQLTAKINTPNGIGFCAGESVNITAEATGSGTTFTYNWKQGTTDVGNANTLAVNKAGNYILEITDNKGCVASASVDMIQKPSPNVIISKNGSTDLLTGGSVILSIPTATNQTYQWLKDGVAISGATTNSYTANEVGKFSVKATANGCSATSETVEVKIVLANELPTISKNFKVSPNPFESSLKIDFNEPLIKIIKLNLITSTGIVLKEWTTSQQENSYDVSGLSSGIYILRCEINNRTEAIKIVKN